MAAAVAVRTTREMAVCQPGSSRWRARRTCANVCLVAHGTAVCSVGYAGLNRAATTTPFIALCPAHLSENVLCLSLRYVPVACKEQLGGTDAELIHAQTKSSSAPNRGGSAIVALSEGHLARLKGRVTLKKGHRAFRTVCMTFIVARMIKTGVQLHIVVL